MLEKISIRMPSAQLWVYPGGHSVPAAHTLCAEGALMVCHRSGLGLGLGLGSRVVLVKIRVRVRVKSRVSEDQG